MKVGRSIDNKNAKFAAKNYEILYRKTKVELYKPRGRKKVKENSNNKFTYINEIIKVRNNLKRVPKR